MNAVKIKESLHELINKIEDEELLNAYLKIIESGVKDQGKTLLHSTSGTALTQREFETKIEEGEADIKAGNVHSHEQIKAHFRSKQA